MSEKKSDKELTDDEETLQYFEHLLAVGNSTVDDSATDDIDWDKVKSLNSRTEEQKNSDRDKFIEEIAEVEQKKQFMELLPKRLQEYRNYIPDNLEGRWIVHIWNRVIDSKLILQEKYGKYKKTKSSSKVSSYASFKDKYKNERSRQALELKIRKIAFYALGMSSVDAVYNPADWTSFICTKPDPTEEYDDITDFIIEQLNDGFKI